MGYNGHTTDSGGEPTRILLGLGFVTTVKAEVLLVNGNGPTPAFIP